MAITRRTRKRPVTSSVDELKALVTKLIKENVQLKRGLARAQAASKTANTGTAQRGLRAILRKVERALDPASAPRSARRSGTAAAASRSQKATTVRKPASPETRAKRLAALAKAREARAAKKATAAS